MNSYKKAKRYYLQYGTLNVAYKLKYNGLNLGIWTYKQRKNCNSNKLTNEQINLLNDINFEWENQKSNDAVWNKMYQLLSNYYSKYHHLYIPISYITDDGVKLGKWVYSQRQKYKNGNLPEEQLNKLNGLDVTWQEKTTISTSFPEQTILFYIQKLFPDAKKYKSKEISEIDIYIPELKIGIEYDGFYHKDVKKDIYKTNKCLKNGIKLIRVRENKCPEIKDGSYIIKLDDDKYQTLEQAIHQIFSYLNVESPSIDLERDSNEILDSYIKGIDLYWYEMYDELKKYYKQYGNVNVPFDYITSNGKKLGIWINTQRDGWKKRGRLRSLTTQKIDLLNALGMNWEPLENQWNDMYQLAQEYFKKNGDLLVNINYEIGGVHLGQWISTQRQANKKNELSPQKIEKLEKIGMIWNPMQSSWKKYYELAKKYYKENHSISMPYNYVYENENLGMWLGSQRNKYKKNKLSKDRINLLNLLDMDWIGKDSDTIWDNMFIFAKEYYDSNGNINVPFDYITSDGKKLGIWIRNQRNNYKQNLLSEAQIIKMNSLQITWNVYEDKWDTMYSHAKCYYQKYGNLEVPFNYITSDNINLGHWIHDQRNKNGKYKLTKDQISKLNAIGMVWGVLDNNWNENYNLAKEYYIKHKNLFIPDTYIVNNIALGRWIGTQRKNYKAGLLDNTKINLLNKISMVWDVNVEQWNEMYLYAKEYFIKNKNLNMPDKYKINGYNIYGWLVNQRKKYKKNQLTKEQIKLLEQIDMKWNPIDTMWNGMYQLAKEYYLKNNNLEISQGYISESGEKLGNWILSQRRLYKESKLSQDKIDKLNDIRMIWNPYDEQWQKMFDEASLYYFKNNNLEIPQRYISESGEKLGAWISNIRQNKNKLSPERIEQLNSIGMIWKAKMEWNDFYELAIEYFNKYGNLDIKCRQEYKGVKLGWWITNQKRRAKENKLNDVEKKKLESLKVKI